MVGFYGLFLWMDRFVVVHQLSSARRTTARTSAAMTIISVQSVGTGRSDSRSALISNVPAIWPVDWKLALRGVSRIAGQRPHLRGRLGLARVPLSVLVSLVLASGHVAHGHEEAPATEGEPALCGPRTTVAPSTEALPGEWQAMRRSPGKGRFAHSVVWTGEEVIFWGGGEAKGSSGADFAWPRDGLAYDPVADTWRRIPEAPISGRQGHSAVWTGTEMLVWGGLRNGRILKDGAAFDPVSESWRRIALPPGQVGRRGHHAAWTGEEMVVWSGYPGASSEERPSVEGLRYDPAEDAWQSMASSGFGPREDDQMVWTGDELIAVGYGSDSQAMVAAYDLTADHWSQLPPPGLSAAGWSTPMWTGTEVLFLTPSIPIDPAAGMATMNAAYRPSDTCWWYAEGYAPPNSVTHDGLWADDVALFVGREGVAYDPDVDAWLRLPASGAAVREEAALVWAGDRLVAWGGRRGESHRPLRGGVQFIPGTPAESELAES